MLLIERDPRFDLVALYVFFEAIDVQPEDSRISVEQRPRISGFTPNGLLSIEQVVHLVSLNRTSASNTLGLKI